MSDDSEEPLIDLVAKQDELEEAIESDPNVAWEKLQNDPAIVLALNGVKRRLENKQSENVEEFFETYDKHVELIFNKEYPIERYGIALTAEFLTEYWRKSLSSLQMSSINEIILKKMDALMEAIEILPESDEKRIITKIVNYSSNRVKDFRIYNQNKAREHLEKIQPAIENLIEQTLKQNNIEQLLSFAYFATATTEFLEILRNQIAFTLLNQVKPKFDELEEDDKYKIAPYLRVFSKIKQENGDKKKEAYDWSGSEPEGEK